MSASKKPVKIYQGSVKSLSKTLEDGMIYPRKTSSLDLKHWSNFFGSTRYRQVLFARKLQSVVPPVYSYPKALMITSSIYQYLNHGIYRGK
ncbi:hypothetical protein PoB_006366400 [Plakobranchus ocellatus]|uniref:Uncharacterized protein n=1 Tax=Plakobranchus ocellatus TaxID=259542 RepID=A0AAV4CZA5_9GAST|nr:hypothetical protein PoB_006366400 [Plakobranchus ocellatus]